MLKFHDLYLSYAFLTLGGENWRSHGMNVAGYCGCTQGQARELGCGGVIRQPSGDEGAEA